MSNVFPCQCSMLVLLLYQDDVSLETIRIDGGIFMAIRYTCYECGNEVGAKHKTSEDGRILCDECSKGVRLVTFYKDDETYRTNVQLKGNIKRWVDEQSTKFGISQSAFINICIAQYKQQMEAMGMMKDIGSLVNKIEELQKAIKDNK